MQIYLGSSVLVSEIHIWDSLYQVNGGEEIFIEMIKYS